MMSPGRYLVSGIWIMMGRSSDGIDQICGAPVRSAVKNSSLRGALQEAETHAPTAVRCIRDWIRRGAPPVSANSCSSAPAFGTAIAQTTLVPSGDHAGVPAVG